MQRVARTWMEADPPGPEALLLSDALGLPHPIANLMVRRGITDSAEAELFLDPKLERLSDPLLLPGMEDAVRRLWKALLQHEKILIFGDYDVDGVTSTTFLSQVLTRLGGRVCRFIPHRMEDGYGLGGDVLLTCLALHQPSLVITVDCGTGSVDAVEIARSRGVDVIVTDHHEASGSIARPLALVNPKLGQDPGLRNLAGVGVTFKLCHALLKVGRQEGYESAFQADMRPLMFLVALGTVADMVPLMGENRILARFGISVLNKLVSRQAGTPPPPPGLAALVRSAGIDGQPLTSYHIGFVIGPRINAAGRMETPELALRLLLTESSEEAEELAAILESANKRRQEIEEKILLQAVEDIDPSYDPEIPGVLVVARRGWHSGVVGIVASRLVRRYQRPAIVISIGEDGVGRGSCRSIEGFDLITQLTATGRFLEQYGGHRMAAGLDILEKNIPAFREAINAIARDVMASEDLRPRQHIDGWLRIEDLNEAFMAAQDRLMPFGHENPTPVWGLRRVHVDAFQVVGNGRHLRILFRTRNGMQDAIGFGLGRREIPNGPVDLAFQLRRNVFRGEERLQLMLQDFRPAE